MTAIQMMSNLDSGEVFSEKELPPLVLLIVAAGSSSRMGGIGKKEYFPYEGGTVLSHTASAFLNSLPFSCVAITYPETKNPADDEIQRNLSKNAVFAGSLADFKDDEKFIFVAGGKSRQESVFKGLKKIEEFLKNKKIENSVVFIHDGARPFVTKKIILDSLAASIETGASVPALTPTDTQKEIDENGFIKRHLVRSTLAAVQTPQVFKFVPLLEAHEKAAEDARTEEKSGKKVEFTDDTEIWDLFCDFEKHPELKKTKIVAGDSKNKKITYPEDLKTIS